MSDPCFGVNTQPVGGHGGLVPCDAGLGRWAVKLNVVQKVIYFRTVIKNLVLLSNDWPQLPLVGRNNGLLRD